MNLNLKFKKFTMYYSIQNIYILLNIKYHIQDLQKKYCRMNFQ